MSVNNIMEDSNKSFWSVVDAFWASLTRLDCSTFLKLGMVEVCAHGVFLVDLAYFASH